MKKHSCYVAHEQQQQLVLACGQLDTATTAICLPRAGVQTQIGACEHVFELPLRAAQQRANTCQQLVEIERFDQIIVGAAIQASDPVWHGVASGQHQDRHV
jgi:hypothetical protein